METACSYSRKKNACMTFYTWSTSLIPVAYRPEEGRFIAPHQVCRVISSALIDASCRGRFNHGMNLPKAVEHSA